MALYLNGKKLSGEPHNYSTDEQIVGTWIDGSTIYEKTVNFSQALVCDANAWTNTPIPNSNISKIIDVACLNNGGTIFYCIGVNRDNASGYVQILNTRNSTLSVDTIILRYTKTT